MNATYVHPRQEGYAAVNIGINRDPIEQIHQLVNLLMIFSMVTSLLMPLFQNPVLSLPDQVSWADWESSRPSRVPAVASNPIPQRSGTAPLPSSVPQADATETQRDVSSVPERLSVPPAATLPSSLGSSLTPAWLGRAPERTLLAPLASPWWLDPAQATVGIQDQSGQGMPAINELIGADLKTSTSTPSASASAIGTEISPAWLSGTSDTTYAAGALLGDLRAPEWLPLSFSAGTCLSPDFAISSTAPVSMTMGNLTSVYTFTTVIASTSVTPTGPLTYTIDLPSNFSFVGNSATAVSSVSGTLTLVQPTSNVTGVVTISARANPISNTLMPGSVITLSYRLLGTPFGVPDPNFTVAANSGGEVDPGCSVDNPVDTNYCPLAGQLPMTITPPPFLVSYGNTDGDLYTVTLRSIATYTMTGVSFEVNPSSGFFFKGGTATGTHSAYGPITFVQPTSDTTPDANFVLRVAEPFPANSVASGETITLVMRIGTDPYPKSGQPLIVTARSGNVGAELACNTVRENIATGRGHLYVRKSAATPVGQLGGLVTFTVYLDNTGLGSVYNAVITDTPGAGLTLVSITPPGMTAPEIKPNDTVSYSVTARVNSCVNTSNVVAAAWPVGNVNNTATFTNPSTAQAGISVANPQPSIAIQGQLPDITWCETSVPYTFQVPLTITNSAGPAANFALTPARQGATGANFTFSTDTPGWVTNGNVFSYTANSGLLAGGETIYMTLTLTYNSTVCENDAGSFNLTPSYSDACFPLIRNNGSAAAFNLSAPNVPSLTLDKQSSIDAARLEVVRPGDTVYFTVTVSGDSNATNPVGTILITDTLPASLVASDLITITTPGATRVGNRVYYAANVSTTPTYTAQLLMQATYVDQGLCAAGQLEYNSAVATSGTCATCLSDSDQVTLVYVDPDPDYSGGEMTGTPIFLDKCRTVARQTVVISATYPISWQNTTYNDPLGSSGVGPVEVIPGSVRVYVDGMERTLDVAVTTAPSLTVAFDGIGTISSTAQITITYQVSAPVNADTGSDWYFVRFRTGDRSESQCGVERLAPVFLSIDHSLLDLDLLEPDTLQSCTVNDVSVNIDGQLYLENATNQQVVTNTTAAPTLLTLSKSVTPQASSPEQTVVYAITVTNGGPNNAGGVVVSDVLPAGLTELGVSSSAGGCTGLPCAVGEVAVGESAVVYIVAQVVATTTGELVNTATVTTTAALAPGSSTQAEATVSVSEAADVVLTQAAPVSVVAGERITYTLVAANNGPSAAAAVEVVDTLPGGLTLADDGACTTVGQRVTCNVGALAVGDVVTYTLVLTANSDLAVGWLLENRGEVSSSTSDPTPGNNQAVAWTRVFGEALLDVSKTHAPEVVTAGELVTYTITVTNAGPSDAAQVEVVDQLPADFSQESIGGSGAQCGGASCIFATLAAGAVRTVTVVARPAETMTNSSVENTVAVTADNATPVSATDTTVVSALPPWTSLAVSKVVLNAPLPVGDEAYYRVVVTNSGLYEAADVIVTDTLPSEMTYAGGDSACSAAGSEVTCSVGRLAPAASRTLLVKATVDAGVANGATLTNSVVVSSATAVVTVTAQAVATAVRGTTVDLAISKEGPATVVAGEEITYTVVVTNNGGATATGVALVDALPDGVSYVRGDATQGSCVEGVTCNLGTLVPDASATITVVGLVASEVASGAALANWTQVTSAEAETNPLDNEASATTTVQALARLDLVKRASSATAAPGARLIYTLTATNSGPSVARGVAVSDTMPAGLSVAAVSSSVGGCTSLPCVVGDLAAGASAEFYIVARVEQTTAGVITNVGAVSSTTPLEGGSSTEDSVVVTVVPAADVAVEMTAPATAIAGERLTYTLVVENKGLSDAADVTLTDTLSDAVTVADAGLCTPSGAMVTCAVGALAAGERITYTIVVTANSDIANGVLLTNGVEVSSSTADPRPENNTANAVTAIVDAVGLSISKRGEPVQVAAGELVTYTITVTNSGPSLARAVVVQDSLPGSFSLVSATASDGGVCVDGLCSFGDMAVAVTRTMTVVASVDAATSAGTVANGAEAIALGSTQTGAATATADTEVVARATLSVTKTVLNAPVQAGSIGFYRIAVTNDGPSAAADVIVTDTLPADTSYAGGDSACSAVGSEVTCGVGMLAAGATRTIVILAAADGAIVDGTEITNSVVVSSVTATEVVTAEVAHTVTQPLPTAVDLAVSKDGPATVVAGEEITYTVVVTNNGGATATGVALVDALPDGVSYVRGDATQGSCVEGVTCNLGTLAPDASATITVVGLVASEAITSAALVNQVQVTSAETETQPADNLDVLTTTATAEALITVSNDVNGSTVTSGDRIVYTVTVTNSGPSAATVFVSDVLPAGLTVLGVSSSAGGCTGLPCAVGEVAVGESAVVYIVAQVVATTTGELVNRATVTTTAALSPGSSTQAEATVSVSEAADVVLTQAAPVSVVAGERITYTLVAANNGPSAAAAVEVVDTLPGGLTLADDGACTTVGQRVTCNAGALAVGDVVTYTLVLTANSDLAVGWLLENRGEVSSSTSDPTPGNNQAVAWTRVFGEAVLDVSKTHAPEVVTAGELVTYTITVTNAGPSDAAQVEVVDQLPADFSQESIGGSGAQCGGASCIFATLAAGAVRTVTVVARPAETMTNSSVENTVAVTADNATPVSATDTTVVSALPPWTSLAVSKVVLNAPLPVGDEAYYRVVVTNSGLYEAADVIVTDTLPSEMTYAGGDSACSAAGSEVTCSVGRLAPAASRTLLVKATVDAGVANGATLTNSVVVSSATAVVTVTAQAVATAVRGTTVDLAVSKEGPATVVAGEEITYTVVVTNNGGATATGVALVDALPDGVSYVRGDATQGSCVEGVTCNLGALVPDASATITVVGLVASEVASGAALANWTQVTSAEAETNPLDNEASATTTVQALARLDLVKRASSATAAPGARLIYTLTATNSGPSVARGVAVSDTMPAGLSVAAVSSSVGGCTSLPCVVGDLAAGASAEFYIVARVEQTTAGVITNVGAVSSTTPLEGGSSTEDSVVVTVVPAADVAVEMTAPATAIAGERLTYTLVVENKGLSDAADVTLTDTLSDAVTVADAGLCTPSGAMVTCAVGALAAGERITYTIVVTANSDIANGVLLTNGVEVSSSTADPRPENNTANAVTTISRTSTLFVTKTGVPDPATAGEAITYTIAVTNSGPSDAATISTYDRLPAGFSLTSIVADASAVCVGTACIFPSLSAGATRTITVVANIDTGHTGGTVENVVNAYGNTAGSATFTASVQVNPASILPATLAVTKQALNSPTPVGGEILYQINVTNTGSVDAYDVQAQEVLPIGVYYAGSESACTGAGGLVRCNLGTLAAGEARNIPLRLLVDSTLVSGTQLVNSVIVTGTNLAVIASAQATSTVFVPNGGRATLALFSSAPSEIDTSGRITYELHITNTGPATAINVRLADALPGGVAFVSAESSQGVCDSLVACQLGDLAVDASAVVTIVGQLSGGSAAGLVLQNVAAVQSDNARYNNQFMRVVFRTSATDIVTTTAPYPILTGSLAGQTTTVERTVAGATQIITFTIEPTQSILGPGSIDFQLYRPCGTSDAIQSTLYADDYCRASHVTDDMAGQSTERPQLLLSLSGGGPVKVRNQQWGIGVRNSGQAPATDVVITNTLPLGFSYSGHTPSEIAVVSGTLGARQVLTFVIPSIAALDAVQISLYGTADSCLAADQMSAGLTAGCGVVGTDPNALYCQGSQYAVVGYTESEITMLTSNDQAASIPLCSSGDVTLIVKNVAVDVDLYDFVLTEMLTDVTYVDGTAEVTILNSGVVKLPTTAFTPTTISPAVAPFPYRQVLIWDSKEMTSYPQSLIDALATRSGKDEIIVEFRVRTYCASPDPMVMAQASAANACGMRDYALEDAQSVLVDQPAMQASKTVRNVTEDGATLPSVFAGVGDELAWTIQVDNLGVVDVQGLLVTDTLPGLGLPGWFNVTAVSPVTTTQTDRTLQWFMFDATEPFTPALPALTTRSFLITGTVSADVCASPKENVGAVYAACSLTDLCTANPYSAQAEVDTSPAFTLNAPNLSLDQCSPGPLTVSIINAGARSDAVVLTYTLPAGLTYAGIAPNSTITPAISPTVGVTGSLVFSFTAIEQLRTETLAISVTNDLAFASVCRIPGDGSVTLSYYDTCGQYSPDATSDTYNVTVLRSDISNFAVAPVTQTVASTQRYTWTLSVPNNGNSATNNLIITTTVREGWDSASVQAYVGSSASTSTSPVTWTDGTTTVITWAVGSLPAGQTWTAQFSAVPLENRTDYSILAEAETHCADGGCYSAYSDTAYNIPLQSFDKRMSGTRVSIAEPFTYTITADFYGNVMYTDTVLTDRLPEIDGVPVFAVSGIVTDNTNASNAWEWTDNRPDTITFAPASITRTVFGPDRLTITVTGYISNELVAQQGIPFTNNTTLATNHDGQQYQYSDAVTGVIKEPILQISKTVAPAQAVRVDSVLTYTLIISHALASDATAYNLVITDVVPSVLAYVPDTLRVNSPSGAVVSTTVGNSLAITVTDYPTPSVPITVTYQATVTLAAEPSSTYTNTAVVRFTSQPGDIPEERTGSGVGPNDYFTSTAVAVSTDALTFGKVLQVNTPTTIGDAITYTVQITLPMGSVRNLVVTDTVPAGLLYRDPDSFITVTTSPAFDLPAYTITPSAGNGTSQSAAVLRFQDSLTNTTGSTAVISWTFRLLVVDDSARTVNFPGARKTNVATIRYVDAFTATRTGVVTATTATIYEPLLHIGKTYVTAQACAATLLVDNFNRASLGSSWSYSGTAWSTNAAGFLVAPTGANSVITYTSGSYSDFSYSAVFSSTDTSGDAGLVFRAQDSRNFYRFNWNRGSTNAYTLQRIVNGVATTLATGGASYTTNRWYHLEIRAAGSLLVVYLDGQQILSASDSQFASGSVGFYANNQNAVFFDNVLVTRLGDAGCTVDSGEFVTYTLIISNQERLTGYNLVITDVLPASTQLVTYSASSTDGASVLTYAPEPGATGILTWTVDGLNPRSPFSAYDNTDLLITVTMRLQGDLSAGTRLTNQALLAYDSQPDSGAFAIQRSYSGGSHSATVRTPDATMVKSTAPLTVTIGETFRYTVTFPGSGGIAANMYTATMTDTLPAGFRMIGDPTVIVDPPANIDPADISSTRSTTKTVLIDFTRIPSYTEVTAVITAVVENLSINQHGVRYTNTATLGWRDLSGNVVAPVTSNPVTTDLVEPQLIIEKTAYPTNVRPGDTVFYTLRIYHAPTSTVPAYNVLISDTLASWVSYISGSWEANNDPYYVASTGTYTVNLPNLQARFPVLGTSINAANPFILRYQAVVNVDVVPGTIITNVADTEWTSLLTDPYGDVRTGSGGINDYYRSDDAQVSLDQFDVVKIGPITITAGSVVTYVIGVGNGSPITGTNARVIDTISFRVSNITGTFSTALQQGVCALPVSSGQGSVVDCTLGDMPPNSTGVVTITGRVDPSTPDGALVDDYATFFITDSNGVVQEREDEAESQVEVVSDLAIRKLAPATASAGQLITYTLVVTNIGPSNARGVDAKDILPAGLTFVAGTSTQGACVSSICQLGEMDSGQVITMVITASVGSNVSGVITNTGQVFSATDDHSQSNNRATATTTVSANTAIHVAKVDLTDPVYAGNTYIYQVTVTNTGPAQANNVVVTDTLPPHVTFEGASPGCSYAAGRVTCAAGDMAPGTWFGFLINVRVPVTITDGTRVTNTVAVTTTTPVLTASSTLSATAQTTFSQTVGSPTDLAITKVVMPAQVTAGLANGNVITYTLRVTNTGLAPATAVQVADFYPPQFTLVSATTSRPITQAQCSDGGVCDLGEFAIGASAIITMVFEAPSTVVTGTYTNTAYVGSASPDINSANNSASVPVQVFTSVTLQASKAALPNPAIPGNDLSYTIFVTNTGPSDATNVTISDTLPANFTPSLVVSSQGGCVAFPCNVGTIAPNGHAWVTINGRVSAAVTAAGQISNTARITSTQTPVAITAGITPTLSLVADVGVIKQGTATAYPGNTSLSTRSPCATWGRALPPRRCSPMSCRAASPSRPSPAARTRAAATRCSAHLVI